MIGMVVEFRQEDRYGNQMEGYSTGTVASQPYPVIRSGKDYYKGEPAVATVWSYACVVVMVGDTLVPDVPVSSLVVKKEGIV